MATKAPGAQTRKAAPAAKPAPIETAAAPAPVSPVADAAPVETAVVESVVETVSDIREAAQPASLKQKGKTMADTINTVKEKGEKLVAELKGRTEDAMAKGKAYLTDAGDFTKGNMEALVESGKIAAKGFEKLGQDQAEFVRKSFEQSTAAFKSMAGVKSPTELMKLHSDYVRSSFDAMVAQTSHQTEAMLKLAGEIAQPISNRFAVAAEKVKLAA